MPNNWHLTPQGQISFLQNWPVGGLHWAEGIPIATFCPNKLCMLQQEHLHLIIFTLIILLPPINTHTQTHFNLWSSTGSNRGSGWSRALGSLYVFSFVQDSGPLTRLFLYFLFISYLFFPHSFIQISTPELALGKNYIPKQFLRNTKFKIKPPHKLERKHKIHILSIPFMVVCVN